MPKVGKSMVYLYYIFCTVSKFLKTAIVILWFFRDTTVVNVNECVRVYRWVNSSKRSMSKIRVRSGRLTVRWKIFKHKIKVTHNGSFILHTVIFFIDFILLQTSFLSINIFLRLMHVITHLFLSFKQSKTRNNLYCTFWQLLLQKKVLLINCVSSD